MDKTIPEKVRAYATASQFEIVGRLGEGNQGLIYAVRRSNAGAIALKFHKNAESYLAERLVYSRLARLKVNRVKGFNVPELLDANDSERVLHLTIVKRPFILDFASARLDRPHPFPEEILREWEEDRRAHFGERWPAVEDVMFEFRLLGVFLTDVHPRNIAFLE